ncbi:MAG: tRNA (guanosine(46)-N7)-methyltransferase TrmB [Clostridia bacterium]|nr:tRNA (guanosine(46)-N7)-methyltransferase TrmB [Clostridia bacterium]
MRRRKVKGAKEKLLSYEGLIYEAEDLNASFLENLGWQDSDVWVEIGMGRGQFILEYARRHPEKKFIGIEMKEEVLLRALQKLEDAPMDNIKFILGNANLMSDFFKPESLGRIFVNFCDPWPKTRWAKRRLTHRNYLAIYQKLMHEGGELHFKTDAEALFEFSVNEVLEVPYFKLLTVQLDLHNRETDIPTTEYEDKFKDKGLKIYRMVAKRG